MKPEEARRYPDALYAVLLGLLSAQIVATVHVYMSNRALYQSLRLIRKAGYLMVPNEFAAESLQRIGPAFAGGLFFMLSIGAGLSILAVITAWSWHGLLARNRPALLFISIAWLLGIAGVNANGFSLMPTAYVTIIPPVVFMAELRGLAARTGKRSRTHTILFLAAPVLLFAVWLPLAKDRVFLDIRDNILLTNALGRKITDFYYDYTLYAAQSFKSLDQKTLKTCSLDLQANKSHRAAIEDIFLAHDYLVVENDFQVDLSVQEQDGQMVFMHRNKKILTTTLREFAADPQAALREFSAGTDRSAPLRLYVLVSLIAGAPVCLYILLHAVFLRGFALLMERGKSAALSVLFCVLIGTGGAGTLYAARQQHIGVGNLNQALGSELWRERVAALRFMALHNLHNEQAEEDYPLWLASPYIAERYWYARVLGADRSPEAGRALMAALDDPNTNVVCMAYYSLGRRGDAAAIDEIKIRMKSSSNWYEQFYAYRALRTLGWRQAK